MDAPYDPESPLYNPESPLSLQSNQDDDFSLDDDKEALDSSLGSKQESVRNAVAAIFESRKKEDVLSVEDESKITTVSSRTAKFVPAFKENDAHLEERTVKIVNDDENDRDHHGSVDDVNDFESEKTNKEKHSQEKVDDDNMRKTHEKVVKKNSSSNLHDSPKKHKSKDKKRKKETEEDSHSEDDNLERKKHKKKKKDHFSKSPERIKNTKNQEKHSTLDKKPSGKYSKMDKNPSEKHVDNSLLSSKKRISESKSILAEISESSFKKKDVGKEKEKSVTQDKRKERSSISDKSDRNKEVSHRANKSSRDLAVDKSSSEKKEKHLKSKAKEVSKPRETLSSKVERKHSTRDDSRESSKKVSKRKRKHSHQRSSSSDSESTERKRYKRSEKSEDKKKKERDQKSKHDKKKHKKDRKEVEEDDDDHKKHKRKSHSTERTRRRSHSSSHSKHKKKKHSETEKKDKSKSKHKKHHTKDKRSRSPEQHSQSKKHTSKDKSTSKTGVNENQKIAESHVSPMKPLSPLDSISKKKESISNVIVFDGSNDNSSHKNDSNNEITPAIQTKNEQLIGLRVYDDDDEQDDAEENGRECVENPEENKETIIVNEDTDSEFERLSDLEKEIEKEKQLLSKKIKSMDNVNKDLKEIQQSSYQESLSQSNDGKDGDKLRTSIEDPDITSPKELGKEKCNETSVLGEVDGSLDKICSPETIEEMLEAKINFDVVNEKGVAEKLEKIEVLENANKIPNNVPNSEEKRTFKLFSKEQAHKLDEELRGVEERSEEDEETMRKTANKDDLVDEAMSKENESSAPDNVSKDGEEKNQGHDVIKDEPDLKTPLRKTKDDLFDDIFSQQDQPAKENDGFAKVLGHGDASDTSPKLTSPILLKTPLVSNVDGVSIRESKTSTDNKNNEEKPTEPETGDLNIDIKKEIIPGLEFSSIPGLDINDESQIEIAGELHLQDSPNQKKKLDKSKIPLLFDTDSSPDKALMRKSPDQLTPDEQGFKRPHTPPGEFTGDTEASQFESYYHIESENDSPYNPEDQSIMEIDLSPIDQSILKQDVLRETVQLRLKDPFSGFENPTWEKIIKAKSKQEAVRHKRKKEENKKSMRGHGSKINSADTKNKGDKMVDYLVRQSRVEQECKVILKQYYKSKDITKDEYKMIMRKAVPQVTMSNSPIIPEKIRSLMKKFVGKCKGQRLLETKTTKKEKTRNYSPTAYSQGLTLPGEQRFRYLNPDLPMPPF